MKNDPVKEFAARNKASPIAIWGDFKPYNYNAFQSVYNSNIDGVKVKFRYVTVEFNGRHKST